MSGNCQQNPDFESCTKKCRCPTTSPCGNKYYNCSDPCEGSEDPTAYWDASECNCKSSSGVWVYTAIYNCSTGGSGVTSITINNRDNRYESFGVVSNVSIVVAGGPAFHSPFGTSASSASRGDCTGQSLQDPFAIGVKRRGYSTQEKIPLTPFGCIIFCGGKSSASIDGIWEFQSD